MLGVGDHTRLPDEDLLALTTDDSKEPSPSPSGLLLSWRTTPAQSSAPGLYGRLDGALGRHEKLALEHRHEKMA
jgi:hypothetical protein